jgi:hypothetical protein
VFNPAEGWSRDASEDVAKELAQRVTDEEHEITEALREFIERFTGKPIGSAARTPVAPVLRSAMPKPSSFFDLPSGQMAETCRLLLDAAQFSRSTNDIDDADPTTTLVLAGVSGIAGGHPTADEIAFAIDAPIETVNMNLKLLVKAGVIAKDGDGYRYTPSRELTPEELRKRRELERTFKKLSSVS